MMPVIYGSGSLGFGLIMLWTHLGFGSPGLRSSVFGLFMVWACQVLSF